VSPVKYELGFYIPEDDTLHSDRRENLRSYNIKRDLVVMDGKILSAFTEHCTETAGCVRGREMPDHVSDYQRVT
jgi:hypothetical protein